MKICRSGNYKSKLTVPYTIIIDPSRSHFLFCLFFVRSLFSIRKHIKVSRNIFTENLPVDTYKRNDLFEKWLTREMINS